MHTTGAEPFFSVYLQPGTLFSASSRFYPFSSRARRSSRFLNSPARGFDGPCKSSVPALYKTCIFHPSRERAYVYTDARESSLNIPARPFICVINEALKNNDIHLARIMLFRGRAASLLSCPSGARTHGLKSICRRRQVEFSHRHNVQPESLRVYLHSCDTRRLSECQKANFRYFIIIARGARGNLRAADL